ncbi:hypothetical protein [Pontixanthobacter sp.]|uniref:hypothetical protein n=1 Tax=Pontixanthobacter sp. TaxID=2792078 RepID=UPI003C7EBFDD
MRFILPLVLAVLASPALASASGARVSEPSNIALFGLGLVGLVVGRYVSRRRRTDDE